MRFPPSNRQASLGVPSIIAFPARGAKPQSDADPRIPYPVWWVHFRLTRSLLMAGDRRPRQGRFPVRSNLTERDPSCCEGHQSTVALLFLGGCPDRRSMWHKDLQIVWPSPGHTAGDAKGGLARTLRFARERGES